MKTKLLDFEKLAETLIYFSQLIYGLDNENTILQQITKNCINKLDFFYASIYIVKKKS
tara:strand:+ start:5018 stop:5191 length:174 start_codon:yes stop_codon:yes gene_type:complete